MYAVFFVLDNPDLLDDVLDAWYAAGIGGVTILESTGFHRRRRQHIPMRYLFGGGESEEQGNLTLLAIVPDDTAVQTCLTRAESIVGDLSQPNTGVFTAWPLNTVKGIHKAPFPSE
jgi:nitrogen regulatory protein PII